MGGGPPSPVESLDTHSSEDAVNVSFKQHEPTNDPLGVMTHNQAYSTVAQSSHSVDERASSATAEDHSTEPETAVLLYSKSKVYLHPSSYLRDNIPGFISIVKLTKSNDYLLAWIPEAAIVGTPDYDSYVFVEVQQDSQNPSEQSTAISSSKLVTPPPSSLDATGLGAAHAWSVPIRALYSLQVQPPTLASWFGHVTCSLFTGETLPPLWFHDDESRSTVLDRDRRAAALTALGAERRAVIGSSRNTNGDDQIRSPSVVTRGETIPPSWGGEALVSQLKLYAHVMRSQLEPSLFLVNPNRTDIEAHSTALFEDEAVPQEALQGLRLRQQQRGEDPTDGTRRESSTRSRAHTEARRRSILHQSLDAGNGSHGGPRQEQDWPEDVGEPAMDNFTFNVLNSFSKLTRGARSAAQNAAQSVLSHPLAKPILKNIPEPIAQFAHAPGELSRLQESAGVGAYDAARVYLAKWARVVAEEGERARRAEVVIAGPGGREEDSEVGAFEVLSSTYKITKSKSTRANATPIVDTEWAAWFDDQGRLMLDELEAKKRIFQRGVAHDVRKEVWPFLLKVYPWTSSTEERRALRREQTSNYERLRAAWSNDAALHKTERWIEEAHRVEIDCRRTDRTHPMFVATEADAEPGDPHPPSNAHVKATQEILLTYVFADDERNYVQGMSDLLSPIYVVCDGDQVLAFECFGTLMERMGHNFDRDQAGMKSQLSKLQGLIRTMDVQLYRHLELCGALSLYQCYRWLLCSFKRELSFDQTLQLWENLWTDHLGPNFHLFVALAILEAHRDVMIRYLREFDEILKYVTQLSQTLDIEAIMADAEVLYATFRQVVESCDAQRERAQVTASQNGGTSTVRQRRRTSSSTATAAAGAAAAYPPQRQSQGEVTSDDADRHDRVEAVLQAPLPDIDDELRELLL